GQQAQCVADAYPDRSFAAQVSFLAPQVDRTTGTLEVRLRVPSPPAWLKQDMTVSADIVTAQRRNTLVVPNDALRSVNGDQATVLVLRGGRAQAQQVKLGLQGLTLTQVVSGLSSGESVLAGNSVAPGERVRLQTLPLPSAAASSAASGNDLPMPGR
ncbi:MAG: efflux RND transporter periplasmic adaptor subunit, partial [Betaproteobacteria bacterium]|nr:efflux RND transporter periplasmic adaptor subunit [Betaproteobacteria bacterium]